MKAIVIIFAFTIVTVLGGLTDEQKEKLKQYKESCISETGVDLVAVENAKKGEVDANNEKLACFFNCILKKLGFITADGNIDWEVARAKASSLPQDKMDRIYNNCQNVAGDGCQKGANLMKCFKENMASPLI